MTANADLAATRACPCLAARRHARRTTRHFDRYLRRQGLRSTQFSVLASLALRGPTRIGLLAGFLELERTTLTRSAATLEGYGWLASRPSDDGRERLLVLTEAGRRVLDAAVPAWTEARDALAERPAAGDATPHDGRPAA